MVVQRARNAVRNTRVERPEVLVSKCWLKQLAATQTGGRVAWLTSEQNCNLNEAEFKKSLGMI